MSLSALQRDVFQALERGRPGDARASRHVRGRGALGPAARLRIYSDQYPIRLHEALHSDYPYLARLLGHARFSALGRAYGRAAGSRHYSLGEFGVGLSGFLSRRPPGFRRADLADLARFEWALAQSFIAEDPVGLVTVEALSKLGPERFPAATVRLAPSAWLVPLEHDVVSLVKALDEENAPPPRPRRQRSARLVWRSGLEVFHLPASARDVRALRRIRAGLPLAEVCAAFGSGKEAARAAFSALSLWAHEQVLCDLQAP